MDRGGQGNYLAPSVISGAYTSPSSHLAPKLCSLAASGPRPVTSCPAPPQERFLQEALSPFHPTLQGSLLSQRNEARGLSLPSLNSLLFPTLP